MAAAAAFATGTSWGTMAIITPIFLPLSWSILLAYGQADIGHYCVLYSTVACVLSGAVWGDHCSPISDTTILSSIAVGCDHIDHVLTQMPYALIVGSVSILFGTLPAGFGFPWWGALIISTIILCLIPRLLGKEVENQGRVVFISDNILLRPPYCTIGKQVYCGCSAGKYRQAQGLEAQQCDQFLQG